ncbi:MAG: SDR family oxidoreductase [Chlamydiales bacterium]|nr:SDR family oxidoreductase [Chlamydiales bacterium]
MSKVILVTGASRGIGEAISKKLLEEGHHVIGIARSFKWEHPRLIPVLLDLSFLDSLPQALKRLHKELPPPDALICNAGAGQFGKLEQFSYEQIRRLIDLNFLSHVYLVKSFLPTFKKRREGDLIFIGSEAALEGKRQGSIYCASKFALRGFTQALRDECRSDHLRVCLINPGVVRTGFFDSLAFSPGEDPSEHLLADDIADTIAYVLRARREAVFDEITLNPKKTKILKS